MHFGAQLKRAKYKPWADKYLDYSRLKKLLREDDGSPQGRAQPQSEDQWTENDEENFVDELTNVELEKVYQHQVSTSAELRERTSKCEAKLQPTVVEAEGASEEEKKKIAEETLKELDKISEEITELKKFSRINYSGFLKIAKKHDRKRGKKYRVRPLLQFRLSETPFNTEDYAPLLYRLSTMYTWARQVIEGEDPSKESQTSVRPKDEYTAHKFWVHQDNLLEVKTYILRRLPVLVYNPQSLKVVDASARDPTITSIYFDNDTFDLYQDKVDKAKEAGSLRLRWTGQLNAKPDILIEKKTVNEESGSRDIRLQIKEKHINEFLAGKYNFEKRVKKLQDRYGEDSQEVKDLKATVDEIQQYVKDKRLEPVLRATYTRSAFQIPGDDRVRVSLDQNLALIREDAIDPDRPCRDPEDWHRSDIDSRELEYPYSSIRKGEISRFEHAILEIKVKDNRLTQQDTWLNNLMSSHLVKEAPKFSKFVHGVAELFEDYVNTLPFWLSDLATDIRRDPHTAFEEEQDKQAKKDADEMAIGSFLPASKLSSSYKARMSSSPQVNGSGKSPAERMSESLSTSLPRKSAARTSQLEPTAEERDSDDDGVHPQGLSTGKSSNIFSSVIPAFSNSRYAQRHRNGRRDAPLPEGVKDMKGEIWIKDQGPLKVEAKVWLANQRTFIKWLHVSVLLGTLSVSLFNIAGHTNRVAKITAVVYTAFAVFAGAWGLGIYLWRGNLIRQRSGRDLDAPLGPIVVSIGLAVALILNFAFRYRAALEKTEGRGVFGLGLGSGNVSDRLLIQYL